MSFPTPQYELEKEGDVYPPAEDTFLLLDALEKELEFLRSFNPSISLEIGSGSGIVTTFLHQLLPNTPLFSLTTDLNPYAVLSTRKTSHLNGVEEKIEPIQADLALPLERLHGKVDLCVFNPPYVPTEEPAKNREELCFAGGKSGRFVLDRLMPKIPKLLSLNGVFYVIALKQNNVPEMLKSFSQFLKSSIVIERWCGIEYLYVLKFEKFL